MSEKGAREVRVENRRRPSLFWPVLLIAAGVLFLLDNLGYADIDFGQLWRLWPVFIILAGLDLLLGRRSVVGNAIVALVSLLVVGAVVWLAVGGPGLPGRDDRGGTPDMSIAEAVDGAERASLDLDFPSGTLRIDGQAGSGSLIEGALDTTGGHRPEWNITRTGSEATTRLSYVPGQAPSGFNWGRGDEWVLHMGPGVNWDVRANLGAGTARLDLTGLALDSLNLNTGAGEATIILPAEGDIRGSLNAGVGAVVLEIPGSMAVRLRVNRALAPLNVSSRYEKDGDVYTAGDWDNADNRVELSLKLAVGAITVREP